MDRSVDYNPLLTCDECGHQGAYDFMGDFLCDGCLTGEDPELPDAQMSPLSGVQATGQLWGVVWHSALTASERAVLAALSSMGTPASSVFPTGAIAQTARLDATTARRALTRLHDKGLVGRGFGTLDEDVRECYLWGLVLAVPAILTRDLQEGLSMDVRVMATNDGETTDA
jgi:hypothetical protein